MSSVIRTVIKTILSYYLSISLLAATLYVPVFVHTCHLFAVTETTLYEAQKCCDPAPSGEERVSFNCCSIDFKTFKADIHTDITITQVVVPELAFAGSHPDISPVQGTFDLSPAPLMVRPPPARLSNRSLLTSIQVFRI